MGNWISGDPQIATAEDCQLHWAGLKDNFICYICGKHFKEGDYWRFIMCNDGQKMADGITCRGGNFMVCGSCDGPTVKQRWHDIHMQMVNLKKRYPWIWKD